MSAADNKIYENCLHFNSVIVKTDQFIESYKDSTSRTHDLEKHGIQLKDDQPIMCRSYKVPDPFEKKLFKLIKGPLKRGIIRRFNSLWARPVSYVPIDSSDRRNQKKEKEQIKEDNHSFIKKEVIELYK